MNERNRAGAALAPGALALADVELPAAVEALVQQVQRLNTGRQYVNALDEIARVGMPMMTRYLAGELPPAIAAEMEGLLRSNPLFRRAFAGVIAAWQAPNTEPNVSADEVDAAFARFKARVATRGAAGR